jgi:hypothetical protein
MPAFGMGQERGLNKLDYTLQPTPGKDWEY